MSNDDNLVKPRTNENFVQNVNVHKASPSEQEGRDEEHDFEIVLQEVECGQHGNNRFVGAVCL